MLVSIITVCYNSQECIRDCLNSVLLQKYQNYEHIIIDGSSNDATLSIIYEYKNNKIHLSSEPDQGIYDAMNKGLALSSGDVIGILNSDDFYLNSDVLMDVVKLFEDNSDVDVILGNVEFVHTENLAEPKRFYSASNFKPWKMYFGFMPPHPAAFMRRSAYEKIGTYKLGFNIGADFEWFVRAFLINKLLFKNINKTLVRMRIGGISTSGIKSHWIASKDMYKALKINKSNSYGLVLSRLPVKFYNLCLFKLQFIFQKIFK